MSTASSTGISNSQRSLATSILLPLGQRAGRAGSPASWATHRGSGSSSKSRNSSLPEILIALGTGAALKIGGIVLFEHDPNAKPAEIVGLTLHSHRVLGPAGISVYVRSQV